LKHYSYYIGIDIGATTIKTGIVRSNGELVSKEKIDTKTIANPDCFIETTHDTIERLFRASSLHKESVGGIGVGAPGWVDHPRGIVHELTNIPNWINVPVGKNLEQVTGIKSFADNDTNVMAAGEMTHGAGRGHRNFICLTLGTGIGGAIVINREIYRGAHGLAGEIGHMMLPVDSPRCACGAAGCLERYVGNRFIVANALQRLETDANNLKDSILYEMAGHQVENITPKLLAAAAKAGDRVALEVWQETGYRLGVALAALVNVLNPECFIIGGGVAKAGAVLFDQMRETMESLAMNRLGKETPVLAAQLGEDAGIIGAATLAMRCIEKS